MGVQAETGLWMRVEGARVLVSSAWTGLWVLLMENSWKLRANVKF